MPKNRFSSLIFYKFKQKYCKNLMYCYEIVKNRRDNAFDLWKIASTKSDIDKVCLISIKSYIDLGIFFLDSQIIMLDKHLHSDFWISYLDQINICIPEYQAWFLWNQVQILLLYRNHRHFQGRIFTKNKVRITHRFEYSG